MKRIIFLFLITLVSISSFGFVSAVGAQTRRDRIVIREAERISNDSFRFFVRTSKGANVYAVRQPSAKMLGAIDNGLQKLFAVARKYNYKKRLDYSDYTIFIAAADRKTDANGNYSPDIAVAANQYAGSVYDQGGFIYAAGMVVAYDPCAFLIGEHTDDFQRVSDIVRYEGEHLILFHNDRGFYRETADHSRGGGHPILH